MLKRDDENFAIWLLSYTWCHHTPAGTPACRCNIGVSFEEHVDDIAAAGEVVWQGGATGLLQQGRPVPIRDIQIVEGTVGMGLNVECSEL